MAEMTSTDLFGEEYIQAQIQKTEQEYAQEGRVYRWIALIFAAVGVLFFLHINSTVFELFFGFISKKASERTVPKQKGSFQGANDQK